MPFSVPEFTPRNSAVSDSWPRRVVENFRIAFSMPDCGLHPTNEATAPFSIVETSTHYGSGQSISAFVHLAFLGLLLFLLVSKIGRAHV